MTKRERERLLTTINTFSQESLHISIKVFARDAMTCVRLLLLDYIARNKIKKRQLVTILERKRIFFMSWLTSRKEKEYADLVSRQAYTCSFTSVRLKSLIVFFFYCSESSFDRIYIGDRDQNINMSCFFQTIFWSNEDTDHKSRCSSSLAR